MGEDEVGNCHSHDVESNDDEGADGYVCHNGMLDAIENLAAIKNSEEEKYIGRVEQDDM